MSDAWNKEMKNVARVMEQGMIFLFFLTILVLIVLQNVLLVFDVFPLGKMLALSIQNEKAAVRFMFHKYSAQRFGRDFCQKSPPLHLLPNIQQKRQHLEKRIEQLGNKVNNRK